MPGSSLPVLAELQQGRSIPQHADSVEWHCKGRRSGRWAHSTVVPPRHPGPSMLSILPVLALFGSSAWATVDDGRLLRAVGTDRAGRFILEVRGLYPEMPAVCDAHEGGKLVASAKGAADQPCATLLGLGADEITPLVASPQCVALEPSELTESYIVQKVRSYTTPDGEHLHTVVHQHEVVARMWDRFAHVVVSSPPSRTTVDCAVLRQRLNDTLITRKLEALTASGADPEQRATTRASLERQAVETGGRFQTNSLTD